MKIAIYTLGCKVNQYETQAMERELASRGHPLVPFDAPADAYIVNTPRQPLVEAGLHADVQSEFF